MKISELPIDKRIIDILLGQGIKELYPPQVEAVKHVLEGKSIVLAIPTASGKSLVSYLGILRAILKGGKALYIVPLKALASEKFEDLKAFESLGLKIGMATGDLDDIDISLEKLDIVIATSEKADSLMRHRARWMDRINVVVADEIHLLHDATRGPTLEVTLTKMKLVCPDLQIIALSATISNSLDLAIWLGAEHVTSDWRPVDLKYGIYIDDSIEFLDGSSKAILDRKHNIVSLTLDTILEDGQVLVFVNSRRSTESLAERIAKANIKLMKGEEADVLGELARKLKTKEDEPTSVGARLGRCIEGGAAFHNAGLTNVQRKFIEKNYRDKKIKCIVATPTLAAGINLPARRVVVRDLTRYDGNYGNVPIPVLEIRQMCGRAGRPQFDPYGEGILVASDDYQRRKILDNYILGEVEAISSKLGTEPALRTHILATIATGFAVSEEELMEFIDGTFFSHQNDLWRIKDKIEDMLEFLEEEELIRTDDGLSATLFGKRTSDLYIDPLSAVQLKKAIDTGEEKGADIIPLLQAVSSTPDMYTLYMRKKDYDWIEKVVEDMVDRFLLPIPEDVEYEFFLSEVKTSLLINDWMEEVDENEIVTKYNVGPGDIRNRVDTAEWLVYSMREIARLFGSPITEDLNHLVLRVKSGIKEELVPLVKLKGIGRKRARVLFNSGFKDIEAIRRASLKDIADIPLMGEVTAKSIKEQADSI
ncbi:MAG: DEAD/DEAH box helicase [Thermoplasmata archaeon]|nr:DEAD/DEAH box helicase [Thermoplasmata archaeon]